MDNLNLNNIRVLVTGGNGYLGTHLIKALKSHDADIYIIDRKSSGEYNEICIDLTDKVQVNKVIKEIKPSVIFHLAAILKRERDFADHESITNANYNGTINLLMALKDTGYDNFIFTSTSEVYGSNKAPFNERMIPSPTSPYSMSKLFAEIAIRTFSNIYKKNFNILRLFNFFGRNMPVDFFIPQLIHALKYETSFKMTKGLQARDFLYINDVVEALLLSINTGKGNNQIFNVCSGVRTSLKEIALECQKLINSNCIIEFGALNYRKNEIWDMVGDNSEIINALGFKVHHELKNILNEIILD